MSITTRGREIGKALKSGNHARTVLGQSLIDLNGAYNQVAAYNPLGISTTGSGEDTVTAAGVQYLDGIRTRAEADFALIPASDEPLDQKFAAQIGFDIASIEAASKVTASLGTAIDDAIDTSKNFFNKAIDAFNKLGNTMKWVVPGVAVLLVLAIIYKRK
jgi:hypothetical protein